MNASASRLCGRRACHDQVGPADREERARDRLGGPLAAVAPEPAVDVVGAAEPGSATWLANRDAAAYASPTTRSLAVT